MSETAIPSGWDTDHSSGYLTTFTGTVKDSWFATDPNYNQGQSLQLVFHCSIDATDQETDLEEVDVKLPVGTGWQTEDGGKTASHPKATAKFHASSIYGKLIDSVTGKLDHYGDNALTADGEEVKSDLRGAFEVLAASGKQPTDAEIWVGCQFAFDEVTFDYGENKKERNEDGSAKRMVSRRVVPITFLGSGTSTSTSAVADAEAKTRKAQEAKVAAAKAKAAKAKGEDAAPAITVETVFAAKGVDAASVNGITADITKALQDSDDFAAFQDAALAIDGVIENDQLVEAIVDDVDGLWAAKASV